MDHILVPRTTTVLTIKGEDGAVLLKVHTDGRVEGDVANASEAGRRMADALVGRLAEHGVVVAIG